MNTSDACGDFYFQWHITEKCNLRCKHCYHQSYESVNECSESELMRVLEEIEKALRAWGVTGSLSFTGGEPFMRRHALFELIARIDRSQHIGYYDILTNGSLIDEEDVCRLAASRKLRRVQLSLEAPDKDLNDSIRGIGAFEKSMAAIRQLKNAGLIVAIMMTISRKNMKSIREMVDFLVSEKVDILSFERFIPEGTGVRMQSDLLGCQDVRNVFTEIHDIGVHERRLRVLMYRPLFALIDPLDETVGASCSIGTNALTIMHDADILPCRRLPIPIGNVLEGGIFKAWYESDLLWDVRELNFKGQCGSCDFIPACRGCRAMAYFASGNYLGDDPHCWKESRGC